MKQKFLLIVIFCLPCAVFAEIVPTAETFSSVAMPAENGKTQKKTLSDSQIESLLTTNLKESGKLADILIDTGKFTEILKPPYPESRSDLRTKLILWIRNNPKTAAAYYKQVYAVRGKIKDGKIEVDRQLQWNIREFFKQKTKHLKSVSTNTAVKQEDLFDVGKSFFEGAAAYQSRLYVDLDNGRVDTIKTHRKLYSFDFKPDTSVIKSEKKRIEVILNSLTAQINKDKKNVIEKTDIMPKRELAAKKAVSLKNAFFKETAYLKLETKITKQHSKRIGSTYGNLTKTLTELYILEKIQLTMKLKKSLSSLNWVGFPNVDEDIVKKYLLSLKYLAANIDDLNYKLKQLLNKFYEAGENANIIFSELEVLEKNLAGQYLKYFLHLKVAYLYHITFSLRKPSIICRIMEPIYLKYYPKENFSASFNALLMFRQSLKNLAGYIAERNFEQAESFFKQISPSSSVKEGVHLLEAEIINSVNQINGFRKSYKFVQELLFEMPFYKVISPVFDRITL